ncbi:hypothetical protein PsAD2_02979 [Pseudovibrio axinellae]|uniref:N-acetyltransferase domain-containing protein n=1 Tax=Pseudovibrio axinellae TaxID=989403 RepID=A0A165XEY0_9HYPH|nr:hypothetical protein [Pseudovibrio axinellae]KZL17643.1 hypothetical protein PsAD2_02979 [Pseudovibrio axinellae]SER45204.1 hypothetical protein SAMN05421798_110103 [Pseudovibrio axinellae]
MVYLNPIEISEAISLLSTELKDRNFFLDFHRSHKEFSNVIEKSAKSKLGENMSLSLNSFTPAGFFGISLSDDGGECVASIAARKDNLGGQCLGEYLQNYFGRIYTSESGAAALVDAVPAYARQPMHEISYVGELWVRPDLRNLKAAKALVKLAILLSVQMWGVGFIYAFLTSKHMKVGPQQYGWTRAYLKALNWERAPAEIPNDLGLVAITCDETADLARLVIDELGWHKKIA